MNLGKPVSEPYSAKSVPESIEAAHVLFMDVVGYSKLLNDVQAALIARLNAIVKATPEFQRAQKQKEGIFGTRFATSSILTSATTSSVFVAPGKCNPWRFFPFPF